MTQFEDELWERLVKEHGADTVTLTAEHGRRSRRTLIGGSAAVLATVSAAAVVTLAAIGGAAPAYAMTQNSDGSYTVTINDLTTAIPELNAKFKQLGIDETVVPVQAGCPTVDQVLFTFPGEKMTDTLTLEPGGKFLAPGFTGVLAAEQLPDGQVAMTIGAIKPPIPSCYSNQAFTLDQTGDANGVPTVTEITDPTTTTTPGG
jgi:hypothetical protein